jgi:hypothetical protein
MNFTQLHTTAHDYLFSLARGKPGCLGCTCSSTRVHFCSIFAHGTAGAVGARLSLRPLFPKRWQRDAKPRRNRAAGMIALTLKLFEIRIRFSFRHCEPTGRREAPPDDRLREAIHLCRATRGMDCFRLRSSSFGGLSARRSLRSKRRRVVADAPRNDGSARLNNADRTSALR